ncbi:MAG: BamA/TamA family outer membrane protein, partial [Armatimonadota bacterium]|nr:BamA/TamA family outer membrane protein [Armatimonadota bacterium]
RPLIVGLPAANSTDTTLTDQEAWISERRRGFGVSVGRPVGKHGRALLDFRSDDVRSVPVADLLASNQEDYLRDWLKGDEGRVTSITLRGIRNTRDYDINPARGALHSFSLELAGGPLGGDWSYSKLGVDLRRYFPVGKAKPDGSGQKVFAVRLMGGAAIGKLSLSENYWLGGAESLRGYREDQFHGSRALLLSSEFRVPFGASLQGVGFFDYGYAWSSGQGVSLSDLKPAVGVGLRVVTPLGPLRLDYGFGQDGGRSHFSIGHVF